MTQEKETTHEGSTNPTEIDAIWMSSRTARQIYSLGEVDKVCTYPSFHRDRHSYKRPGHHPPAFAGRILGVAAYPPTDGWARGRFATRRGAFRAICARSERVL